jgi:hypothetical protein
MRRVRYGHRRRTLDVGDCADELLGGQSELVVNDPLRLVVQTCRRVQCHRLVVLDRLHEHSTSERAASMYLHMLSYMCVCIYIYIYIYINTYVHAYINIYTYICVCVCVCM